MYTFWRFVKHLKNYYYYLYIFLFHFLDILRFVFDNLIWWGGCVQYMCADQKTILWSWFSPYTFMYVPGLGQKGRGLHCKCFYLLSHLDDLKILFKTEFKLAYNPKSSRLWPLCAGITCICHHAQPFCSFLLFGISFTIQFHILRGSTIITATRSVFLFLFFFF